MPTVESSAATGAKKALGVDTVVLLCTYNESDNIHKMMDSIAEHLPHADVLVVDDNSPDGTADFVRRHRRFLLDWSHDDRPAVYLLQRSGKHGLGTATREGLLWCLERSYEFIIQMDADLSHDPAAAPRLLEACNASDSTIDVAVGSRYIQGGRVEGLPPHRRCMSRLLNGYATRLLRLPIKDCSGSFRCYRTHVLQTLDFNRLSCSGYGFLEEILVALVRAGAVLHEVPIHFHTRYGGTSKLSWRDALGAIRVIHRLAFQRGL